MSNELSPFEKWILAKGHALATITKAERIKLGDEYLDELKSKRADQTKIVQK